MDLKQYRKVVQELITASKTKGMDKVMVPEVSKLLGTIKNRIQVGGKGSDNSNIGSYSVTPMYATKDQFVKKSVFKPVGKGGFKGERVKDVFILGAYNPKLKSFSRKKGKVVTKNKLGSMYLDQGYKELRDIQGRPTDRMNFTYTGDLMLSYQMQAKAKEIVIGLNSEKQALKRKGLEEGTRRMKGKGKVFQATKEELDAYKRGVAQNVKNLTISILKGV